MPEHRRTADAGSQGSDLNSERIDSFAPARLKLAPCQLARCFPRSFTFYLALPKRSIETRLLPSSLAATHRGFAFYVAFPKSSIETRSLPSSLIGTLATLPSTSLIPSAPFTHSYPRQLEPSPARTLLCRSLRWHRCQGEASRRGLRSMGHNYARDNARKRAKRRKKHERLASAKKKQPKK